MEKKLSYKSNSAVELQLESRENSALRISWLIDDPLSSDTYLMSVRLAAGRGHRFSVRLCKTICTQIIHTRRILALKLFLFHNLCLTLVSKLVSFSCDMTATLTYLLN